jgi:hypothetical protein
MSDMLILEFAADASLYNTVNGLLGINPQTGEGDWPAGMLSHAAGVGAGGTLVVVEVWESQAAQGEFMSSRLGPALGQAGAPEPQRVEWLAVAGTHSG